MPLDAEAARTVVAALGLTGAVVTPLGQGFASDAWLVRHDGSTFALRIERPDAGYPSTYRAEHGVMTALADRGAPVPRPVAGSWTVPGWDGPAWSLTSHVAGGVTPNDRLAGLARPGRGVHPRAPGDPGRGCRPLVDRDAHPAAVASDLTEGLLADSGRPVADRSSAGGGTPGPRRTAGLRGPDRPARVRRPDGDGRAPVRPRPLRSARGEPAVGRRPVGGHRLRRDLRRVGGLGVRLVRLLHVVGARRRRHRRVRRRRTRMRRACGDRPRCSRSRSA